jgi:hypothetical protein
MPPARWNAGGHSGRASRHEPCFIANSIKTEVAVETSIILKNGWIMRQTNASLEMVQ